MGLGMWGQLEMSCTFSALQLQRLVARMSWYAATQYRVANSYLDESGDASNSVRAIELFEKAAAQGHLYAAGRVP